MATDATAAPNRALIVRKVASLGLALGLLVPCVVPAVVLTGDGRERSSLSKCSNNLRQVGLAALQYADDRRFMPHVGPTRVIDGDQTTNATPKSVRALLWYGYHDNPEGWICPASYDLFIPIQAADYEAKENLRLWFWNGEHDGSRSSLTESPFVQGDDPALVDCTELSYAWTRRGLNSNARSNVPLAADRAERDEDSDYDPGAHTPAGLYGNHPHGTQVLLADASVQFAVAAGGEGEWLDGSENLPIPSPGLMLGAPRFYRSPRRALADLLFPAWIALMVGCLVSLGWSHWTVRVPRPLVVPRPPRPSYETAVVDGIGPTKPTRFPPRTPEGKRKVTLGSIQRCPFCHDDVIPDDDLVACRRCGTPMHRECRGEGGTCGTLGCRGN
jgi:Prokaryotic RING finger family 1